MQKLYWNKNHFLPKMKENDRFLTFWHFDLDFFIFSKSNGNVILLLELLISYISYCFFMLKSNKFRITYLLLYYAYKIDELNHEAY